jgi:hypothetical protein
MADAKFRPVPLGGEREKLREVLKKFPASGSAKVSAKSLPQDQKTTKRIPQTSQNGPQILPRGSKMAQKWQPAGKRPKKGPKLQLLLPKAPQEGPKEGPTGAQVEPNWIQFVAKVTPRGDQEG